MRILPAIIALAMVAGFSACGEEKPKYNGYGPGATEQQRYCDDQGWNYDAKSNSCVLPAETQ